MCVYWSLREWIGSMSHVMLEATVELCAQEVLSEHNDPRRPNTSHTHGKKQYATCHHLESVYKLFKPGCCSCSWNELPWPLQQCVLWTLRWAFVLVHKATSLKHYSLISRPSTCTLHGNSGFDLILQSAPTRIFPVPSINYYRPLQVDTYWNMKQPQRSV